MATQLTSSGAAETKGGEDRYVLGTQFAVTCAAAPAPRVSSGQWPIGARISYQDGARTFQVERVLTGGMAVVYIVTDVASGEPFVVKTPLHHLSHSRDFRARFKREAEAWVALGKHPNIVRARGFEYLEGRPHIYLEYITHGSLREYMRNTELTVSRILRLGVQICRGMDYAASKGIHAHRDLKPDNILLNANLTAKVTDFGLVKMLDDPVAADDDTEPDRKAWEHRPITHANAPGFGTRIYMPPEQWLNASNTDIRSDIYAFGVMMYEMLTGMLPFVGRTAQELREQHFYYQPDPPSSLRPNVPPSVDQVVARCLQKKPQDRYPSFAELSRELTHILNRELGDVVPLLNDEQMTVQEINERGAALFNLGRYQQALACFHDALQYDRDNAVAWANRGVTLAELGELEEALASFDEALRIDPDAPIVLTNKGTTLQDLKRFDDALACYDRVVTIDSRSHRVWRHRSQVLNTLGRYEEARDAAGRACQLSPDDAEACYQQAYALFKLGQCDAAQEALDRREKLTGKSPTTMLLRARIMHKQGNYVEACRLCTSIPRGVPEYLKALRLNIECALQAGNLDDVSLLLADIATQGLQVSVLSLLLNALDRAGPSQRLLVLACQTAVHEGDFVTARQCYERWALGSQFGKKYAPRLDADEIFRHTPVDGLQRLAQGTLLSYLGDYARAARCLRDGLRWVPDSVDGWRQLGEVCARTGSHREAMVAFERLSRLQSESAEVWCLLAESALRCKEYQLALEAAQRARRLVPDSAVILFLCGAALFGLGDCGPALRYFNRALALDEKLAVAWWNKGLCARRTGRNSVASRCINHARTLDPRFWRMTDDEPQPVLPYPLILLPML